MCLISVTMIRKLPSSHLHIYCSCPDRVTLDRLPRFSLPCHFVPRPYLNAAKFGNLVIVYVIKVPRTGLHDLTTWSLLFPSHFFTNSYKLELNLKSLSNEIGENVGILFEYTKSSLRILVGGAMLLNVIN